MDPARVLLMEELQWYFGEAPAHCGLRTSLGAQLRLLKDGVVADHGYPTSDAAMAEGLDRRLVEHGGRISQLRSVAAKLAFLPSNHAKVLEAAYATPTRVMATLWCSLELACSTPTARDVYARSIASAKRRTLAPDLRARQKGRIASTLTIRMWMQWLALTAYGKRGAARAALLRQILQEAADALDDALDAYSMMSERQAA